MTIAIVGASVAGMRTAQALRMNGYTDPIVVIGEEVHVPYDKPPLSKEMMMVGGTPLPVPLIGSGDLAAMSVDLRLGVRATAVDVPSRSIQLSDGESVAFTDAVVATGVRPRVLPGTDELDGVYTIRTVDDAVALRSELVRKPRVVVIGAGFIGAEFASAAIGYGASVTMVEAQPVPLAHIVGPRVGADLAGLHAQHGVTVLAGASFAGFTGVGRVAGVQLSDGRHLPADLVVVGIGAVPNVEWLASSGLPTDNGLLCDERLEVLGHPGIYGAGDVARWHHPLYRTPLRIEHWTNANEHASMVAASVLGLPLPRPQLPYVWSDQYGHRIQMVGRPSDGVVSEVHGDVVGGRYVAAYADEGGVMVGAVVVDDPRTLMNCRKAIGKLSRVDSLGLGFALKK